MIIIKQNIFNLNWSYDYKQNNFTPKYPNLTRMTGIGILV